MLVRKRLYRSRIACSDVRQFPQFQTTPDRERCNVQRPPFSCGAISLLYIQLDRRVSITRDLVILDGSIDNYVSPNNVKRIVSQRDKTILSVSRTAERFCKNFLSS